MAERVARNTVLSIRGPRGSIEGRGGVGMKQYITSYDTQGKEVKTEVLHGGVIQFYDDVIVVYGMDGEETARLPLREVENIHWYNSGE